MTENWRVGAILHILFLRLQGLAVRVGAEAALEGQLIRLLEFATWIVGQNQRLVRGFVRLIRQHEPKERAHVRHRVGKRGLVFHVFGDIVRVILGVGRSSGS